MQTTAKEKLYKGLLAYGKYFLNINIQFLIFILCNLFLPFLYTYIFFSMHLNLHKSGITSESHFLYCLQ